MVDFTETPYAEDFQWELSKLTDEWCCVGMTRETAIMVLQLFVDELRWLESWEKKYNDWEKCNAE